MKTINIETAYKIQFKEYTQWRQWNPCIYYDTEEIREEVAHLKMNQPEIDFRIIEVVTTESVVDWD